MSEVSIQPEVSHSPQMDEFLNHHGIKGMKWGVRRTPEQLGHATARKQPSGENKPAKKIPAKKTPGKSARSSSSLSDDELQRRINRLNMEERYDDLVARKNARNKSGVGAWAKEATVKELKRGGEKLIGWAVDKLVSRITEDKKDDVFNINDFRDMDINNMDADTLSKVAKYYKDAVAVTTNRSKLRSDDPNTSSKKTDDAPEKPKDSAPDPTTSKSSTTKPKDSAHDSAPSKPAASSSSESSSSTSSKKKERVPWIYRESGSYYRKQAERIAKDRRNRDKDVMKWLI